MEHRPTQECVQPEIHENARLREQLGGAGGSYLLLKHACMAGETIVAHDSYRPPGTAKFKYQLTASLTGELDLPSFPSTGFVEQYAAAVPLAVRLPKEAQQHQDPGGQRDAPPRDGVPPLFPTVGVEFKAAPLRIRRPHPQEAARRPHFSACTVPILIFSNWFMNYAEFFTRVPALVHDFQRHGVFDRNVSLVLAIGASLPLLPYHVGLLQPFSVHPVTDWTSFARSPRAHERMRCFEKILILGMANAAWPVTYDAAQAVLSHYRAAGRLPQSSPAFKSQHDRSVLKLLFEFRQPEGGERTVLRSDGAAAAAGSAASGSVEESVGERVSNVLPLQPGDPRMEELAALPQDVVEPPEYKGRPVYPGVRLLLNLRDALDDCNRRDWTATLRGTRWTTVECAAHSFSDGNGALLQGMAVAASTDVFVGLHGAGEMNAMFMRPGSIKVQLRQKEFGTKPGARFYSNGYWPRVCEQGGHPLQCWFLNFEEDKLSEPGIWERTGMPTAFRWRDRHLRLKMSHLEHALSEILRVGGMDEFRQRWKQRRVAITFEQGGNTSYSDHTQV